MRRFHSFSYLGATMNQSVLLLPFFLVACAASPDDAPANEDDALVNAPVDTKNAWSVGVCASEPNTDPAKGPIGACVEKGTRCSGSLIAPNLVLTAQHCIRKIDFSQAKGFCDGRFTTPLGAGKVRVTVDPSVLAENPRWREVAEVLAPGAEGSCQNDLVVLRLAQPVAASDATPIRLDVRSLVRHSPDKVAVVGRGGLTALIDPVTQAPIDDAPGNLTRRFKTDIPFVCVSDQPSRPCKVFDLTSPPSNSFELPPKAFFSTGEGMTGGDSGAAILTARSFAAGRPVAIGVHSAGTFGPTGVGNHGLEVRLDTHKDFLRGVLASNQVPAASVLCDDAAPCN
jgi:hypothetical protein